MSDLIFIQDVIFGLKLEYGEDAILVKSTISHDLTTGEQIETNKVEYPITAIALPKEKRGYFLRTVLNQNAGYLEPGQQDFIIEKEELPGLIPLDYILYQDTKMKVLRLEDYKYAWYLLAHD